jgi:hypothetical protein
MKNRFRLRQRWSVTILMIALMLLTGPVLMVGRRASRVPPSRTTVPGAPQRIVAIADVHGAYEEFLGILQRMGLIDAGHKWAGGATIFVQVGDVPDRGVAR